MVMNCEDFNDITEAIRDSLLAHKKEKWTFNLESQTNNVSDWNVNFSTFDLHNWIIHLSLPVIAALALIRFERCVILFFDEGDNKKKGERQITMCIQSDQWSTRTWTKLNFLFLLFLFFLSRTINSLSRTRGRRTWGSCPMELYYQLFAH